MLVGRSRELEELTAGAEAAVRGSGSLWLVAGEPGIGKSRLLEECTRVAEEKDLAVHWGRCWEAGGAPAYWPWVQVLRSVFDRGDGNELVAVPGAASLLQILPELAALLPEAAPTTDLEPVQARFQLMDAVSNILRAAARNQPMAIALEDLHAADPASVDLLDFFARQIKTEPILLLGTYREVEAQCRGLADGLAKVSREAQAVVRLGALGADEVATCVRGITGSQPEPQLVSEIYEASEGNPLCVVEITNLMASKGQLDQGGSDVAVTVPGSVKTVISERAASLAEPARELLCSAAVIGREFLAEDVADLVEDDPGVVEANLGEAVGAGLLLPMVAGKFRFAHILTREVFYHSLAVEIRRARHLRWADRLEQRSQESGQMPWPELAHHLLESGPAVSERTVEACIQAGKQAETQLAFDDAAEIYSRAVDLVERFSTVDPERRCRLLLDLAQALLKSGATARGRETCREAAAAARQLGDSDLLARAALTYGSVFVYSDVDRALIDLLEESLRMLAQGDSALRARLLARLAAALQPSDDPHETMDLARSAIAMARRVGDRKTLLQTIRSGCSALMDLADPAERFALNREHVLLSDELGVPFEAVRGHMRIVIDTLELGDLVDADDAIEACDRLAARSGIPHHRWPVASFRAMRAMMNGQFEEAEHWIDRAERNARRIQDPNAARTLALQRVGLLRACEALDDTQMLDELFEGLRSGTQFEVLFQRTMMASNHARCEDQAETPAALVDGCTEAALKTDDRSLLCAVAEIASEISGGDLVLRLYQKLKANAEHCVSWGLFGLVWEGPITRTLALLASRLGRARDAQRHFEAALACARGLGAKPIAARTAYEYARHLVRLDEENESERSGVLLSEAEEIARSLGQTGLLRLITALRSEGEEHASAVREEPRPAVPSVASFSLERDGEMWACTSGGESFRLKNTKGVRMLARLVADPGREIHVLDLSGVPPSEGAIDGGDAGEVLDPVAKKQYRRRVEELEQEIAEARSFSDAGREERAREELDFIAAELSRAFGLSGRERRAGSAAERARVNVQRRLRDAVKRISEHCPAAGKHLDWALKTGTFCIYDPS
jgi:tetratricopeptide (TPR) repeat protein